VTTARLRASRRELERVRPLVYERDGGLCAMCGNSGDQPLQIQHRIPRQMGGRSRDPDAHALDRLVTIGAKCHDWIERHERSQAVKYGYLVPAGLAAAEVAVLCWDGWFQLTADGQRIPVPDHRAPA
jgi:hypothetical protein